MAEQPKRRQAQPRQLAAAALVRIERGGYANLVLGSLLAESGLSARDRGFASRLVYGTLERLRTLDARLAPWLKKPIDKLDAPVRAALRMGLYQMLYMDSVPAAVAVSESVRLVRALGKSSAAGFVNAVLRRAGGPWEPTFATEAERLGVTYSVSDDIARLLLTAYPDAAQRILQASFTLPPLQVRVNTLRTDRSALAARLADAGVTARPLISPAGLELDGAGDPAALPAFAEGLFHVQGLASQLAAEALDARPGQRVLDLCAAPGGKSASLAERMENRGALFCCDEAASRLSLIEGLLARLGITIGSVRQLDAAGPATGFSDMDRVLCDVPCSGLGVLAKKPDIRYKRLGDLTTLIETQKKILANGAAALAPGGRLVYSTCTLNPAENAGVVRWFLDTHPGWHTVLPQLPLPEGVRRQDGMLTFVPGETAADGFFVACLERL